MMINCFNLHMLFPALMLGEGARILFFANAITRPTVPNRQLANKTAVAKSSVQAANTHQEPKHELSISLHCKGRCLLGILAFLLLIDFVKAGQLPNCFADHSQCNGVVRINEDRSLVVKLLLDARHVIHV